VDFVQDVCNHTTSVMSFREVGFKTGSRILLKNLSRGGAGPDIPPHFDERRRYQWKMKKVVP